MNNPIPVNHENSINPYFLSIMLRFCETKGFHESLDSFAYIIDHPHSEDEGADSGRVELLKLSPCSSQPSDYVCIRMDCDLNKSFYQVFKQEDQARDFFNELKMRLQRQGKVSHQASFSAKTR